MLPLNVLFTMVALLSVARMAPPTFLMMVFPLNVAIYFRGLKKIADSQFISFTLFSALLKFKVLWMNVAELEISSIAVPRLFSRPIKLESSNTN